ncbi:unnamed protein product [Pylaiella littoralis]
MEPAAAVQVQDPCEDRDRIAEALEISDGKEQSGVQQQRKKSKRPLKPLSQRKVKDYNDGLANRGVVYLSRVPPFMKPAKVKHLMEQHGVVTRVYLVEEDQANRRARKKAGGNSGKRYTEGWVEFEDKKIARAIAESLNNTLIGGKKRNFYHDDTWNLKYLRKFKWDHLTEKVAYERRVRSQKLRLETMQAKRENARYVELVESGRSFAKMEERKRKRKEDDAGRAPAPGAGPSAGNLAERGGTPRSGGGEARAQEGEPARRVGDSHQRARRRFKQSSPVADVGGGGGGVDLTVLRSVFGGGGGGGGGTKIEKDG